jgi:hypothetical protein
MYARTNQALAIILDTDFGILEMPVTFARSHTVQRYSRRLEDPALR